MKCQVFKTKAGQGASKTLLAVPVENLRATSQAGRAAGSAGVPACSIELQD